MGTGLLLIAFGIFGNAAAQAGGVTDNSTQGLAIGAGLAIGLAGLGTGLAQKDIGAAAVGATAEDPGFLGRGILLVAIPETIVIFGFVVAFLLLGRIGG
jgi:V/A-type H+-transporting ATPase subunit K